MIAESKAIDLLLLRITAEKEMWKSWEILAADRNNPEKLQAYVSQLRRVDHLKQIPIP